MADVDTRGARTKLKILREGASKHALAERLRREVQPVRASLRSKTPVRTGRLQRSTRARVTTNRRGVLVSLGWFGVFYARYVEARYGLIRDHEAALREVVRRIMRRHVDRVSRRARNAS